MSSTYRPTRSAVYFNIKNSRFWPAPLWDDPFNHGIFLKLDDLLDG